MEWSTDSENAPVGFDMGQRRKGGTEGHVRKAGALRDRKKLSGAGFTGKTAILGNAEDAPNQEVYGKALRIKEQCMGAENNETKQAQSKLDREQVRNHTGYGNR